jgi:hypothetical protein
MTRSSGELFQASLGNHNSRELSLRQANNVPFGKSHRAPVEKACEIMDSTMLQSLASIFSPSEARPRRNENMAWFLHGPSGATRDEVRQWWQERRPRYNRDLFLVGIISWILVLFAGSAAVKPGEDFAEPFMMILGPILYAIFANLAYSFAATFDTLLLRGAPRRKLLKAGYIVWLVLTGMPGAWALLAWLVHPPYAPTRL